MGLAGLTWIRNARRTDVLAALERGELPAWVYRKGWQHLRWHVTFVGIDRPQATEALSVEELECLDLVGLYGVRRTAEGTIPT